MNSKAGDVFSKFKAKFTPILSLQSGFENPLLLFNRSYES